MTTPEKLILLAMAAMLGSLLLFAKLMGDAFKRQGLDVRKAPAAEAWKLKPKKE